MQPGAVTLTGSETEPWTHTWEDLPKYSNGHEIVYRAAETNYVGGGGIYYQTSYDFGTNSATVTNTAQNAEAARMNFTARVVWNDANNQDGVRPQSVTLKLVAKVGEELVTSDAVFGADFQWTREVAPGVDNTWTTVWENLPRFTTGNEQITYSIVEMNGEQEVTVGGQLNDEYKVAAYNNFGDGYMTVTNTHTPATVNITINKIWDDANDQDGIQPESVTGSLYQAEGGSYVKVQDFVITGENWSTTITGLPQKEDGQEIAYYVSENEVAGYELTASGSSVTVDNNKAAYPVINEAVTLTNTHTPGTVDWGIIAAVKAAVKVPVIGNGDIASAADALAIMKATGCDGVMVGRAALGDPWLFAEIKAALAGEELPARPGLSDRMAALRRQIYEMCEEKGEWAAMPQARSQALYYMKGLKGAAALRRACCELQHFLDVDRLIDKVYAAGNR